MTPTIPKTVKMNREKGVYMTNRTALLLAAFILYTGCEDKSTGDSAPHTNIELVGDWSYGRLQDSMFDSATYSFRDDGNFHSVGVFSLLGHYYQVIYQNGTWKAGRDSISLTIDTIFQTRDYGKTFSPMTNDVKSWSISYYVHRDTLGLRIKDDDGSIDTLKLRRSK